MTSYLIYIVFWELLTLGGSGYIYFGLHRSGWWIVLGIALGEAAYPPERWYGRISEEVQES